MTNPTGIERAVSFSTAFVSLLLPVTQLFVVLNNQNPFLFIDPRAIVPTSVITLVIGILVILLCYSFPYFRFTFNKKGEQKYFEYLRTSNAPVEPGITAAPTPAVLSPFYFNHDFIAVVAVLTVLISGFTFIAIGLVVTPPAIGWALIQSLCYMLFVVATTHVVFHLVFKQFQLGRWKENKITRAKRAVELAIAHSAIQEVPPIRVEEIFETSGFPNFLVTSIRIKNQLYQIFTDVEAAEFLRVTKLTKKKNQSQSTTP